MRYTHKVLPFDSYCGDQYESKPRGYKGHPGQIKACHEDADPTGSTWSKPLFPCWSLPGDDYHTTSNIEHGALNSLNMPLLIGAYSKF